MSWKQRLQQLRKLRVEQQLWRTRVAMGSPQGRLAEISGQPNRSDAPLINFCSNDYLGLANHPAVKAASCEATKKWGAGSGASHLVCGHFEIHEQLEHQLAEFVGAQSALVFSTGYMANLALPQTFLSRHGLLVSDKLNHASVIDAGQMSAATMKRYPHLDFANAQRQLAQSDASEKMLMSDGVFSMDGDTAPIAELNRICESTESILVIDDAHGFGVLGESGGGSFQAAGIEISDHRLMMGTLGKAVGSFGAFVAGDTDLIEALIQFGRSYIYTTALPPGVIGASIAALKIIKSEPCRREKLRENVAAFRRLAIAESIPIGDSTTPIQPVLIGDSGDALFISKQLKSAGFGVVAIRPPTVAAGSARLRVTLSAEHEFSDIEELVRAITIAISKTRTPAADR